MQADERIKALISTTITAYPGHNSEASCIAELRELCNFGLVPDVAQGFKAPLKSGKEGVQLRALSIIRQLIAAGETPLIAEFCTPKWQDRLVTIAKEGRDALRKDIIYTILEWRNLHPELVESFVVRLSESRTLGPIFEYCATRNARRATSPQALPVQPPTTRLEPLQRHSYADPAPEQRGRLASQSQSPSPHTFREMDNIMVQAHQDMAALEYAIEHPEMLNARIVANCRGHLEILSTLLQSNLPRSVQEPLGQLHEQLDSVIECHDAIYGTEESASDNGGGGGEGVSSAALEAMRNSHEAMSKELEEERRRARELQGERDGLRAELQAVKEKYATAKSKNQKLLEVARAASESAATVAQVPAVKARPIDPALRDRIANNIMQLRLSLTRIQSETRDIHRVAVSEYTSSAAQLHKVIIAALDDRAMKQLQSNYEKEVKLRKFYFNMVQELKGNIRVYVRIRPSTETEIAGGYKSIVEPLAKDELQISGDPPKKFEFESVFGPNSTQDEVFTDTAPLVDSVVDGYNVCIFAYGQTGSGKTFTMGGPEHDPGVSKRALRRLFDVIDERRDKEIATVSVSVLEIYCEQIRDLLVSRAVAAKTTYEVRTSGPCGHYVTNLTEREVHNADDIDRIMQQAAANRSEGCTNMNQHSSRSHMLLFVVVRTRNVHSGAESFGKLCLIDLAGSERLDKSGAEGQAAKEAAAINKSLSALGDVIAGLSSLSKHVPYRNSTLTFLLQDSMAGQAKVLMFCCVSPVDYNASESTSSLLFASRARGVSLGQAKKNVAPVKK